MSNAMSEEVMVTDEVTGGMKGSKPERMSLVPSAMLIAGGGMATLPRTQNWLGLMAPALVELVSWWESGGDHRLANASAGLLMLLEVQLSGVGNDNRNGDLHSNNPPIVWPSSSDAGVAALPAKALLCVSRVYTYGARKYSEHNWRRGYKWSLSYDALMRHLLLWRDGHDIDEESSLPHLAHAVFHAFALSHFQLTCTGTDDRP